MAANGALDLPRVPFSDWELRPEDIEICRRPDGRQWEIGAGAFGQVQSQGSAWFLVQHPAYCLLAHRNCGVPSDVHACAAVLAPLCLQMLQQSHSIRRRVDDCCGRIDLQ